jgi:uncharacterized protein (TIGR03118 family)
MPRLSSSQRRLRMSTILLLLISMLVSLTMPFMPRAAASTRTARITAATQDASPSPQVPVIAPGQAYQQTNLVSDLFGVAFIQDPELVNPWGIAQAPASAFGVANNRTSIAGFYGGGSLDFPLEFNSSVTIPDRLPTGAVANGSSDFVITSGSASAPARFIFASETGNILAWSPTVPANSTAAQIVATQPALYTGLAIGATGGNNFLYAVNFGGDTIDVFDKNFARTTLAGNFTDPTIPRTSRDSFSPFNIQNLGGTLYVSYAKTGAVGVGVNGPGNGFVSRFDTNGVFLGRVVSNGPLDAPWGMAIAPPSFGVFANALLVGNVSPKGRISAFDPTTGAFLGQLQNEAGSPIEIDGLRAITFGNDSLGSDPSTLYFTADTGGEGEHGIFGSLKPTTASATSLIQFGADQYAISEGSGHIDITVLRSGDASGTATVNVATFDETLPGHASQNSDYEIALGTLHFNPGETSKTLRVLVVDDKFVEGDETVNLILSNPTGAGVGLGSQNTAELKILDNDSSPSTTNPIDDAQFFVRQQYLDFLNREPDPSGFAFWTNQITACGSDAACIEQKRVNVSAAFFLSVEFQRTGMLAYLAERAAFGPRPNYGQFELDTQAIQKGFVFGQPGADAQLEANKQAFFNDFVARPEFVSAFGTAPNDLYVDILLQRANLQNGRTFLTQLTGSQEVPPNTSRAFGTALFILGADETTALASVSFTPLTGSQTAADINGPASSGVNAPAIISLPNGSFRDVPVSLTPTQVQQLKAGQLYINIHSTGFPGGELRGQLPSTAFRDSLVAGLNAGTETRATVLRKVAESQEFANNEFVDAFVLMQYFGYLRRDPDNAGFNFWRNKLLVFNGDFVNAEMVKAFITSNEYRQRFGL